MTWPDSARLGPAAEGEWTGEEGTGAVILRVIPIGSWVGQGENGREGNGQRVTRCPLSPALPLTWITPMNMLSSPTPARCVTCSLKKGGANRGGCRSGSLWGASHCSLRMPLQGPHGKGITTEADVGNVPQGQMRSPDGEGAAVLANGDEFCRGADHHLLACKQWRVVFGGAIAS